MYATTAPKTTHTLSIPKSKLSDMIFQFENVFGLKDVIAVCDTEGKTLAGVPIENVDPDVRAVISVGNQPVGFVCLYTQSLDPVVERGVSFLAGTIAQIDAEIWRQNQMADEVLARYDELNLIYELGTKFAMGIGQDEIVEFVLMETNRIVRADAGVIYVWNPDKASIQPVSYFGKKTSPDFWGGRLRELALSTLYAYEQAQLFEADRVICAPLRFNDELLGSLVLVYEQEGKRFRANDINLLTTLTQNTALFIYVARLIEKLAFEKNQLEQTLKELQATKDKLSQNERLSVVGQTVSSLVHDMRKPLSNVMGYAGLLQEPDLTNDERYQFASQIIKYVEVFSAMAQEVLDYTSGDAGINKSPVTVEKFMAYVADLLNPPGLERAVKIIVENDAAHDTVINIDSQRFVRVFQNLVNNAVDAIESKGGTQVEVLSEQVGNTIRFSVTDDGPGVPAKIVDTLFEPFVTMDKSNGTGLGLAIVDRMVKNHGGSIHYETSPQGGARFVFTVPVQKTR